MPNRWDVLKKFEKVCQIDWRCCTSDQINWFLDVTERNLSKTQAKAIGGVEKVINLVYTDGLLISLLTTLQVWTPEATISLYFTCNTTHPNQEGDIHMNRL